MELYVPPNYILSYGKKAVSTVDCVCKVALVITMVQTVSCMCVINKI